MKLFKTTLIATALVAAGFVGNANAESDETTFEVSITITESCEISATPIEFGEVVRGVASTATGTLTVNCSDGTPYTVTLDGGSHLDGTTITANSRRMANGTVFVAYGLYSDSNHTTVWGNDTASGVPGSGSGNDEDLTVYADVTASATNVARANYTDTVTATVTY